MKNRKAAIYFSWSRPQEIDVGFQKLDNRYPTLFEFKRLLWPLVGYDWGIDYPQDITGFLDHVVLEDFKLFGQFVQEITDNPLKVIQREGDKPPVRELDEQFLSDIDTLIIVSLDHLRTRQRPTEAEVQAIRHFLERENSTLIVCPHHDIGKEGGQAVRAVEFKHHGDLLVPSRQRIGGFATTLLASLGYPIENRYGLNPARAKDGSPALLKVYSDRDKLGLLNGVPTFNIHPHLPHLWIPRDIREAVQILAKQPINLNAPEHPFVVQGNRFFNALLWIPPIGTRAGNIFVCDATLWSAAFEGLASLKAFWKNLLTL